MALGNGATPINPDQTQRTQQDFENELKALASKAKEQTSSQFVSEQLAILLRAIILLVLAAIYSNISQLTLSPVYGSIPSGIWHSKGVMVACFLGWSGNLWLRRNLPWATASLLPVIAINIPMLQFYLFKFSGVMGATYGPIITEALTFFPLLALSVSCVASVLERLELSVLPGPVADAAPGIGSYTIYRVVERYSGALISSNAIGRTYLHTRLGLQAIIGASYTILALFSPSKLLLWTLPAVQHAILWNYHVPIATQSLNATLNQSGWSLLARNESVTGYISVLESLNDGFRVMRCDHSLLGGEWLRVPNGLLPGQTRVKEPIYAIFAMLEAVRLIEVPVTITDSDAKALVIGLGIGTTPGALMAHGIDTTIVEIDPVVHEYAMKYFSLPENHTPIIDDAVSHMAQLATSEEQKYDYIVHDVFTGGAEPVDLFTVEFLSDLHRALKPNGVIAINYAGDLLLPSARLIVRTIKSVFPSCRIYREMAQPSASVLASQGQDFTNMVIFCVNSEDPIRFRQPQEADYLRSGARKAHLLPIHEIKEEVFEEQIDDGEILSKNDTARLTKWQQKSALGHWNVMRTVLPDQVWEAW